MASKKGEARKKLYERDLSPLIQKMMTDQGYCVHGEVTVFDRHATIDHVAHLGPCHKPTKIITLELKTAMCEGLIDQLHTNDIGHYHHEHYAVTFDHKGYGPDHALWKDLVVDNYNAPSRGQRMIYFYTKPGWITFDQHSGELRLNLPPTATTRALTGESGDPYQCRGVKRLLLVEQNKGAQGGVKLAGAEKKVTHLSCATAYFCEQMKREVPMWLVEVKGMAAQAADDLQAAQPALFTKPLTPTALRPHVKRAHKALRARLPLIGKALRAKLVAEAPHFFDIYSNKSAVIGQVARHVLFQQIEAAMLARVVCTK
jgi:hypothetical protein